jgi:hypothetical protein
MKPQAKLRGDLPHRRLHAPAKRVGLVEDPVVLWHGWVLGNAVHDEWVRTLLVLLGNAVSDGVEICADILLPTRAKSKLSMMHSSHHGLGLVSPSRPSIANCAGGAGLEPHSSQMGAGVFAMLKFGVFATPGSGVCAVLGSGVFSMMGECVGRYGRKQLGRVAFKEGVLSEGRQTHGPLQTSASVSFDTNNCDRQRVTYEGG